VKYKIGLNVRRFNYKSHAVFYSIDEIDNKSFTPKQDYRPELTLFQAFYKFSGYGFDNRQANIC